MANSPRAHRKSGYCPKILPSRIIAIARRYVADRCLLTVWTSTRWPSRWPSFLLWLITLQKRTGPSPSSTTLSNAAILCWASVRSNTSRTSACVPGERQFTFATANLFRYVDQKPCFREAANWKNSPSNDQHADRNQKTVCMPKLSLSCDRQSQSGWLTGCIYFLNLQGLDGDAYDKQREIEAEEVQLLVKARC